MGNTLQIRRGSGAPTYTDFAQYELAYDYTNDVLYIRDGNAMVPLNTVNAVDTSGTPIAQEYARFTDANTIEGRSAAGVRTDLGLVIGTNVLEYNAELQTIAALNPTATEDGKVLSWNEINEAYELVAQSAGTITSVSGMTDNNVLTASGSTTINGESNFTFDGSTGLLLLNQDSNAEAFRVTGGGGGQKIASFIRDVGVASPYAETYIHAGSADPQITFRSSANQYFSMGIDLSASSFKISENTGVGTNDRLTIDTSGNVGIGTASPSYSLHVIGTGQFSDDVRIGDDLVFNANANYIYQRDSVGTLTRVLGINGSNTTYIGPIDAYAGGSVIYGISSNVLAHYFYTDGAIRMKLDGPVLDLPNTGDWSSILNNTNSGGLRFGSKDAGGTLAYQIELSNTGNYVKLNENTTVTGTMSVSSVFYGNQIDLTGELNFTGNGNKIIDVQTLEGNNYLLIRHHSTAGNQFENALKLTANGSAELYYNNSKKFETTNTGATVTGNIVVSGTVDGRDVASDGSKLDGIESGATADQSASEILTAIKTVDGSASGLDADTLDGVQGSSFVRSNADDSVTGIITFEEAVNMNATDSTERLYFKNNGTTVGDIGTNDTTWLRINQSTAKNIYTPRYIRADSGFFVDGATQGITGDGVFRAPNGSVGTPTYSFSSDTNTGMYLMTGDQIGFSTGGVIRASITNNGINTLNGNGYYIDDRRIYEVTSNSTERGGFHPIIASIRNSGKQRYLDEDFNYGTNSVILYNNAGGTNLVVSRITASDDGIVPPNSSGKVIKVAYNGNGTTSPGFGGVYQLIQTEKNHTFVQIFQAKLPAGRTFVTAANSMGTNSTDYFLTSPEGTGKWEWYARVCHAGDGGTFSTSGFIYVTGGSDTAFTWYIANMTQYDVTETPGDYTSQTGYYRSNYNVNATLARGLNDDDRIVIEASETKVIGDTVERARFGSYGIRNNVVGSAGSPSYSFVSDTNTGMLRTAENTIGFSTGGSTRFTMNGSGVFYASSAIQAGNAGVQIWDGTHGFKTVLAKDSTYTKLLNNDGTNCIYLGDSLDANNYYDNGTHIFRNSGGGATYARIGSGYIRGEGGGSVGTPQFSFQNDPNTGMYSLGADDLGFSAGGVLRYGILNGLNRFYANVVVGPNNNNSKPYIQYKDGYDTASTPSYSWYFDNGCGIGHPAGSVIAFSTGSAERARITNTGLKVIDGSAAAPSLSFTSDPDLGFYRNGANNIRFSAGNSIRGTWNGDGLVLNGGSLGVNVAVSTAADGRIDAGNDIVAYSSDKRLKENIRPINNALDKVNKLSGFIYNWNKLANEQAGFDMEEDLVGVYAQDVEEVLPEAVKLAPFDNDGEDNSKSGENYLTVQYEKMVPLLIEAIKEQQQQINELKEKLNG